MTEHECTVLSTVWGSYSRNSSFAGNCCFSENLVLYLMIYVTSAFNCCKGTGSHITLFVKRSVNPNFMHLFHAPPYRSSIQNYLKTNKKSSNLNSHFTALCLCSAPTCLIHVNGSPDKYGDARMKIEKTHTRDSEETPALYTQIQFTTDDRTLQFCIKHLMLIICETQSLPRFYSNFLPFYIHMHTNCTVMNIQRYASVAMLIQVLHCRNVRSFNLLLEILN